MTTDEQYMQAWIQRIGDLMLENHGVVVPTVSGLALVISGKPGHHPIIGAEFPPKPENLEDAWVLCDRLNSFLGYTHDEVLGFIAKSMRGEGTE